MCLVIFGFRGVGQTIGKGEFHCPQCAQVVPYSHTNIRRFFTLFFIPIIPAGDLGEYIQCARCQNTYTVAVLSAPPVALVNATVISRSLRQILACVASADGDVNDVEADLAVRLIQGSTDGRYTRDWFSQDVVDFNVAELLASMRSLARAITDEGKEHMVGLAAQLAVCDGEMNQAERDLINSIAEHLGVLPARVTELMQPALEARPKTLST